MNPDAAPQFAAPRIDARALLGLHDPSDTIDWGPIRAAQLNAARQLSVLLLAANTLAAGNVALFLRHQFPVWQLGGWSVLVVAVTFGMFARLTLRHRLTTSATPGDVRDAALDGVALGIVWSIAPLWFGATAQGEALLDLWVTLALVMTASAVAMAALPLATMLFLGVLGGAVAVSLALSVNLSAGAAAGLFAGLLMAICFARGRALVVIRAAELALAERDATVSLLLRECEETAADWLWEVDAQRRVVRAGSRFAHAIGRPAAAIEGRPLLQVLAGAQWDTGSFAPAFRPLLDRLTAREAFRDLAVPVTVREEERWWQLAASPRHDENGAFIGFRGVGSDVTAMRRSAEHINRMARHDALTGLPNRLHVNEVLARAMADADRSRSRCAFLMIDLDRFKAVNDTLGHPVGDRLLGCVSQRLHMLMTDNEVIGRLGGDEFAVVVRDARDATRLEALARTIIARLSQPYEVDQHTLHIGASIGLAVGPRDGRSAETLVRSADLALYRSKDAGGGVFRAYEPELHAVAEQRRVMELALRGALRNDELHLDFQPLIDTDSGALTGFEALLRWTHPELGSIGPATFVPLAEDTRLIAPIGEWVLRRACAEAAQWDDDIRIAVNISPQQLQNPAFVSVVAQALAQSGIAPSRLELEVTERIFTRSAEPMLHMLEQLRQLGCRLSLDDFGTGYASLGYLSRTRFSSIKIDGSFVRMASGGGREAIAIIRAVVALADSLGLSTTAEGVETAEEHAMVRTLGCARAQGFHFGRPVPAEEARRLAVRRDRDTAAA